MGHKMLKWLRSAVRAALPVLNWLRVVTCAALAVGFLIGVCLPAVAGTLGALPGHESGSGALIAAVALARLRWPARMPLITVALAMAGVLADEVWGWIIHGGDLSYPTAVLIVMPVLALLLADIGPRKVKA